MAATNALDVKVLLFDLIKAADVNNEWHVAYAFDKSPGRTYVYVGEIQWDDTVWKTNRGQEETFTIKVVVNFRGKRMSGQEVEAATMAVSNAIQAAVRANPNLGDPAVITSTYKPRRVGSFPADDANEGQLEAEVSVTARF